MLTQDTRKQLAIQFVSELEALDLIADVAPGQEADVRRWLAYTYECLLQNIKPASKARTTRRNTFTSQDALYDIDRLLHQNFYGTAYLDRAPKAAPSLGLRACRDSACAAYCGYWLLQGPAWHTRLCDMAGVYGDNACSHSRLTFFSARVIQQGLLVNPPCTLRSG